MHPFVFQPTDLGIVGRQATCPGPSAVPRCAGQSERNADAGQSRARVAHLERVCPINQTESLCLCVLLILK